MAVTTQSFRTALAALMLAAGMAGIAVSSRMVAPVTSPTGSVSGLPIPRFVSLKSDRVNARSGPNKDQEVRWVYTHAACRSRSRRSSRTGVASATGKGAEGWVYHSLLSGKRTATVVPKTERRTGAAFRKSERRFTGSGPSATRCARRAEVLQRQLVPVQRQRL